MSGQVRVTPIEIGKKITALTTNPDGKLLIGSANGYVESYDGIITEPFYTVEGQPQINKILNVKSGSSLLLTSEGLVSSGENSKNLSGVHHNVFAVSKDENLLISDKGIFKKRNNTYIPANESGLPAMANIQSAKYIQLKSETFLLIDSKLYEKTTRWKLKKDSVYDISTTNDNLYLLTQEGITNDKGEILHYAYSSLGDKILALSNTRFILLSDNLVIQIDENTSREIYSINTSLITDITEDKWSNIWISAGSYLYRITDVSNVQKLPTLTINSVNGEDSPSMIKIDKDFASLRIKYDGVHLTQPNNLVYQTKLGKQAWSSPTKKNEFEIDNIKPGSYDLQVRATIDGTNYSYSPTLKVLVEDNTISYIWLGLLLTALGILLTAIIANTRYNRLKKESQRERQKLIDQNRILALQQKSLQLQMNPHFIFNALNSVKGLIAKGDSKLARKSLTDFAQLMRLTLDQSRQDSISIQNEVDYLSKYLMIEKWTNQDRFDYKVTLDEDIDPSLLIPNMLIQPFAENAVKHAFKGKTAIGNISIHLSKADDYTLHCVVQDDGVGIDHNSSTNGHKSVAIEVVKERLESNRKHKSRPKLTVTSPSTSEGGTKVDIYIPIVGN